MNIHASFARKPRLTPKILVDRDPTNAVYYDPWRLLPNGGLIGLWRV